MKKVNIPMKISALHVKFDKLIDLLITNQSNNIIEKPENVAKSEIFEMDIKQMKPLATESDIIDLEKNLCNQEFEMAFVKVMSEIGGMTGKKDGNKIAYLLMDRLFERQLLTQCSWTGSTKNNHSSAQAKKVEQRTDGKRKRFKSRKKRDEEKEDQEAREHLVRKLLEHDEWQLLKTRILKQIEIFEMDIKQMKPLATESDIIDLEKNLCNQEFETAFVKVMSEIGGMTDSSDSLTLSGSHESFNDTVLDDTILSMDSNISSHLNKKRRNAVAENITQCQSSSSSLPSTPNSTFDGSNFQTWKFQMRSVFTAYGLLDIVTGTKVMHAEQETPEAKAWIKDNAKAMFLMSSSMEHRQMKSLLVCTTATEMWQKLSAIHEQKSATNKLILTQRFHEYRMDSSDSVVQHVAKVQNMAMQLKDLGENVSPVAIMAKIISSLPAKFNPLKTAWDSVAVADQTVDNLVERLIKEELRLTAEDETATAFAASTSGRTRGHYSHECQRGKKGKQPRTNSSNVAFFTSSNDLETPCHENSVTDMRSKNAMPSRECAKELLQQDISEIWLTDSGASKHVTSRRE
ncbi:PREDICTED: uncharacterized protein LOC105449517 [Wasmannia auropunctata]|uniref:uncharacterized protein LOC105449517 n=1 Tax=Wasmannia auropunctata TaxID=64793 RepID=UPI0005EDB798|nr:PREDICTED: uncharacterized protein LOC105449517 [Wasmannia auropunctata]